MIETLTQKVNSLMPTVAKSDKVAAYSEPQVDFQSKIEEFMKRVEDQINTGCPKVRSSNFMHYNF